MHRLLVRLEGVDYVHVGLPVLGPAPLICCHHPGLIVAKRHAADGAVMALQRMEHTQVTGSMLCSEGSSAG